MSSERQLISSCSSSVSCHENPSSCSSSVCYNEDVMTEIFLHLPIKSIRHFRCVSKQWRSLLSDPLFIRLHAFRKSLKSYIFITRILSRSSTNDLRPFYLNTDDNKFYNADFSYLWPNQTLEKFPQKPNFELVSSCNGLLLFRKSMIESVAHIRPLRQTFYICNPSTRKYLELERIPDYIATAGPVFSLLAFDPCTSPYYKVIFFWIYHYEFINDMMNDFNISIYSSETKSCKLLDLDNTSNTPYPWRIPGIYFNGAICWADRAKRSLHYFDINKESFNVFPKPPPNSSSGDIEYFGAYGGHLHLILNHPKPLLVDVFELKKDYSAWVPKYKVDFEAIAVTMDENLIQGNNYVYWCLFYKEEDPIIIVSLGLQHVAYNLRDHSMNKFYAQFDELRCIGNGRWGCPLPCNIGTLFEIE